MRFNFVDFMHRFQFMKACYGCLKVPNVASSHSWTPDKVKNLCIAGDLYVRAFKPIVIEEDLSKGDEQGSTSTAVQGLSPTTSSSSNPVATHSVEKSYDDIDEVSLLCSNQHANKCMLSCSIQI
jgi:hypothetical protein